MIRLAVLAAGVLFVGACSDACSNAIVSRVEAPDGRHTAVMFQRDCGATTGFSTQITLLETGDEPAGAGNAFVADTDHGAAAAGEWGGPWAEARWVDANHLLIRLAPNARIFTRREEVSGVRISYEDVRR